MPKLDFNFIFVGGVDAELIELVELVKAKHPEQTVFIDKVPKILVAGYMPILIVTYISKLTKRKITALQVSQAWK